MRDMVCGRIVEIAVTITSTLNWTPSFCKHVVWVIESIKSANEPHLGHCCCFSFKQVSHSSSTLHTPSHFLDYCLGVLKSFLRIPNSVSIFCSHCVLAPQRGLALNQTFMTDCCFLFLNAKLLMEVGLLCLPCLRWAPCTWALKVMFS